jgi:polyisoprenyl-phosphate glycosyltransferase
MTDVSIVSPIYYGENTIFELTERIIAVMEKLNLSYEIIYVEDNSPDKSWSKIKSLANGDHKIKGLKLSKNFGQHKAIAAGLDIVSGNRIVVMDCDLQDQPEEIEKLYSQAAKGFDIVRAKRENRQDSYLKRLSSRLFYFFFNSIAGLNMDSSIANFGIYDKKVIDAFKEHREKEIFFVSIIDSLGFNKIDIPVSHAPRTEGKSTYSFKKLFLLGINVALVGTNRPLLISAALGFFMSLISILIAVINLIAKFIGEITVSGFTSTMFSIWFVGGLLLLSQGIIGIYLGRVFDEIKKRPRVNISEYLNINE